MFKHHDLHMFGFKLIKYQHEVVGRGSEKQPTVDNLARKGVECTRRINALHNIFPIKVTRHARRYLPAAFLQLFKTSFTI